MAESGKGSGKGSGSKWMCSCISCSLAKETSELEEDRKEMKKNGYLHASWGRDDEQARLAGWSTLRTI